MSMASTWRSVGTYRPRTETYSTSGNSRAGGGAEVLTLEWRDVDRGRASFGPVASRLKECVDALRPGTPASSSKT